MFVLGIETSCDETALAIVERGACNRVVSEKIKTQIPLHAKYGGVVPEIASRNHYEVIDHLYNEALSAADLSINQIDLIAVTNGPGLIGSLLVGLSFAKALSHAKRVPLVPVDHVLAHIESAFIENPEIKYPLVSLVASGGHTAIFLQNSKFSTQLISRTRDDACGEVFDKVAKFFGYPYPGGPILDQLYRDGDPEKFSFTVPRMSDGSNDFSFSGYKTAVLRYAQTHQIQRDSQELKDLCASFLHSVVDYLLLKLVAAAVIYQAKSVIVAGGVSRNSLLRTTCESVFSEKKIPLHMPAGSHCTDNASMVAWLGYEKYVAFPHHDYFDIQLGTYSRASFSPVGKMGGVAKGDE
jgi:N6-L-threonylcarbamoyladenine synthase